jgi:hypothetical protein
MGSWDAMVDLDVEQVLWADRHGVFLGDLVSETAQGQPPRLAGLFDDLSEAWGHAHDLSISFEVIDLQTIY